MKPIGLSKFGGIAPLYEGNLKPGMAVVAQDCELANGKVRPLPGNSLVEALSGPPYPDSLIQYLNTWYTGSQEYYLEWLLDGNDALIFLNGGTAMKTVGGVTVALGQPIPNPPTVTNLTTDTLLTSTTYEWTATTSTTSGASVYYCQLAAGGNPGLDLPAELAIDDIVATQGSLSAGLTDHQWAYGNVDTLGYNTIYVCLAGGISYHTIDHLVNPGNVNGTVYYLVCTDRTVGGMMDKSGPSSAAPVNGLATVWSKVQITAPTFYDPNATHWYIYRLSSNSGAFMLVATLGIGTTTYIDNTLDANLGTELDTEYTGSQTGVTITYGPPTTTFDGIANSVYNGMLFAWKGNTLYWCEPGVPDSWPPVYNMNMEKPIKTVVVGVNYAAIFCEDGCYPISGTDSEVLYASTKIGTENCTSTKACSTTRGIVFVTEGGLAIATNAGVQMLTDEGYGLEWWNANVGTVNFIAEVNRRLIVACSNMTLMLNASRGTELNWSTLSSIFYAGWENPADGFLYVVDSQGIKKFMGSQTLLSTCAWQSGKLYGDRPVEKTFDACIMRGSGSVSLSLTVDGSPAGSKAVNLDSPSDRDKRLRFPEQNSGRYCEIGWTGSGLVDDVVVTQLED
jgi:hypothetical protein